MAKIKILFPVALACITFLASPARSDPLNHGNVPPNWLAGSIAADRTLTAAAPGPTYFVYGDVTVEAGATLTIEPGVRLDFAPNSDFLVGGRNFDRCELTVRGTLAAISTQATGRIIFTGGQWFGLVVESGGVATLAWAEIAGAIRGLMVLGQAEVTDCVIHNNAEAGVMCIGSAVLENVQIFGSTTGIWVFPGASFSFTSGSVSGVSRGIYAPASNIALRGVTVGSSGDGVLLYDYASGLGSAIGTLQECTISGSGVGSGTGLRLGQGVSTTPRDTINPTPTRVSNFEYGVVPQGGNVHLRSLLVHDCGAGISVGNTGPGGNGLSVDYCTIVSCGTGLSWGYGYSSISNTIVARNLSAGVLFNAAYNSVSYTDSWNPEGFNWDGPVPQWGPSLSAFDPYFLDPGGRDFHLSPQSLFTDFSVSGGEIGAYGPGAHSGPTAVRGATLVTAVGEPGVARLRWQVSGGEGERTTVFRRLGTEEWSAVAGATADGSGYVSYEDHSVSPGLRYGYGLGVHDDSGVSIEGEAWVDIPAEARLGLAISQNPAVGPVKVAYSLLGSQPAEVALLDLMGRRVESRSVTETSPAPHEVTLGAARELEPGVYWVRLGQGSRSQSAKVCVVR